MRFGIRDRILELEYSDAARPGLEPGLTEPEPVVLPLHHQAKTSLVYALLGSDDNKEFGASCRTRTDNLRITNALLYQLS